MELLFYEIVSKMINAGANGGQLESFERGHPARNEHQICFERQNTPCGISCCFSLLRYCNQHRYRVGRTDCVRETALPRGPRASLGSALELAVLNAKQVETRREIKVALFGRAFRVFFPTL